MINISIYRLIRLLAEIASQAGPIDPLDSCVISNLNILDQFSACNDDTGTFVATDERQFGIQRPVTVHGVEICVANTGELDINENLIRTWLLNRNLLVNDWLASLLDDLCPLLSWDLW